MIPDVPNAKSVADIVQQRAKTQPDFEILTYLADGETDERPLTYAEFDRQAQLVAGYLQAQGLKGERVLLLFPQGLEYMIALFGCFYAGVIAVPAYPPRNNRNLLRIRAIIENTGATAIFADQSSIERMVKMAFDFTGQRLLAYEDVTAAQERYTPHAIEGKDIAYLQYTSGSTGKPKGVIIRHENVLINAQACRNIYPPDTKCAVNWIPMFHDMGLIFMMSYLLQNARCYFMSPVHFIQKPIRWLDAVSRYEADYTVAPNFAFDLCCEKIKREQVSRLDLSHLRSVLSGSERVQLKTILDFSKHFERSGFRLDAFKPGYGLAEATLAVSYVTHDGLPYITPKSVPGSRQKLHHENMDFERPQDYHVSIGPPVEGCTVRIVDPATKEVLEEGQEGEVWASFEGSIATGYWGNEEASQETFYNELPESPGLRFLRTGDLGFLLGGEVYITGRTKDMIIIRGQNYYPNDIEFEVAQAHPALQKNSGAAFAMEIEGGEHLAVVNEVKRAEWRNADPDAVIEAIRRTLADAFEIVPTRIALIFPMSLPKTSSGKAQRQRTKQMLLNDELRIMKEWSLPRQAEVDTPVLSAVTPELIFKWLGSRIAQRASLPVEQIDADSSFQDFPLESVDAAELSEELSQQLGFTVEAEAFWAMPTLQALAEHLYEQYQAAKA